MRVLSSLATVAALSMAAAPAFADSVHIYPYHGKNFCPAHLQPVSEGGEISCGEPNTHATYRQVMAHPGNVRHSTVANTDGVCAEGEKGC